MDYNCAQNTVNFCFRDHTYLSKLSFFSPFKNRQCVPVVMFTQHFKKIKTVAVKNGD